MKVQIEPIGADSVEVASTEVPLRDVHQELVPVGPVGAAGDPAGDLTAESPLSLSEETLSFKNDSLLLQAVSGQTDPVLEVQDANGNTSVVIGPNGFTQIGTDASVNPSIGNLGNLNVKSLNSNNGGDPIDVRQALAVSGADGGPGQVSIRAVSGQTDPLLDLQDENGSVQAFFSTSGELFTDDITLGTNGTPGSIAQGGGGVRPNLHVRYTGWTMTLAGGTPNTFDVEDGDGDAHLTVDAAGDIELPQAGEGVILTSPDGNTTKRVYLDNSGNLQTESV